MASIDKSGGSNRRLKRALRDVTSTESLLAKELVRDCVWGEISPQILQKYARLADLDVEAALDTGDKSFHFKSLRKLGHLGAKGNSPATVWRDLEHILEPSRFHDLCDFHPWLTIRTDTGREAQQVRQDINDPHAVFAQLFELYPEACRVPTQSDSELTKTQTHKGIKHVYHKQC